MNHIFYQTKTYFTNTGDVLINKALINELRNYGKIYANCSANIPVEFLRELDIKEEEREETPNELSFILSVVKKAIQCKKTKDQVYVFSGPGDLYGGGRKLVVRNLASGLVFPVLRLCGVKLIRIGRSIGSISKMMAISEWLRGIFLNHSYVRDTMSLQRCHNMGIKKAKYCPDLSWAFYSAHKKRINHTNAVMVNLRNSIYDDVDEAFVEATINKCKELLENLNCSMNEKMKVYVAYQIKEDEGFSQRVYEQLSPLFDVHYINQQLRLSDFEEYYGKVDYHISNRMHSLLAGYKYGSLPLALIDPLNHVKISGTLHDCGLEKIMVDIYSKLDSSSLAYIQSNREECMEELFECEKKCCQTISDTLNHIFLIENV